MNNTFSTNSLDTSLFYSNIFGTDGIRGKVGSGFFVEAKLEKLGLAIAQWTTEKYQHPRIIIAYDTRQSSDFVKKHISNGLSQLPTQLFDAGILPTPSCYALLHSTQKYDCAIVLSASHNPYQDNGIKIFDAKTIKLSLKEEQYISALVQQKFKQKNVIASTKTLNNAGKGYVDFLTSHFEDNFLKGKKIILDTANGATYQVAPQIFKHLGATTITIHNQPNGKNINFECGSTHPKSLVKSVIENNADFGFAFDGDGDRVIIVNYLGEILDGDDILALLIKNKSYLDQPTVIGTVMSNQALTNYITNLNKNFIRSDVGDKKVLEKLQEHNLLLGGENSGHIICRDYLPTGDGIFTALKMIQTAIETNNFTMKTFTKYPQILLNIKINQKKDLNKGPFKKYISQAEQQLNLGRIFVRYSGTENLLRIMVEDKDAHKTKQIAYDLAEKCKKELNS